MSHHQGLLDHARGLLETEAEVPDVAMRRSVSAAYYALFHLLAHEAADLILDGSGLSDPFTARVVRAFEHTKMREVALEIDVKPPKLPDLNKLAAEFGKLERGPDFAATLDSLREVCKTFVVLQQARHDADYNLSEVFTLNGSKAMVESVERAFQTWGEVRQEPLAKAFLLSILLAKGTRGWGR